MNTKQLSARGRAMGHTVPGRGDAQKMLESVQRIALVPAEIPLSGGAAVSTLKPLASYRALDGVPRKATVIVSVAAPAVAAGHTNGVYVRITQGGPNGSVARWFGAPCIVPVEGSRIAVDGVVGQVPFLLAPGGAPPPVTGAAVTIAASAFVIEGDSEWGRPIALAAPQAATAASAVYVGPALLTSLTFTNTGAAPVCMAACDAPSGTPALGLVNVLAHVYVPGKQSVTLGRDVLGPVATGLVCLGVTPPFANPITEDPNDAGVIVSAAAHVLLGGS